jgi:hypothetical protein
MHMFIATDSSAREHSYAIPTIADQRPLLIRQRSIRRSRNSQLQKKNAIPVAQQNVTLAEDNLARSEN